MITFKDSRFTFVVYMCVSHTVNVLVTDIKPKYYESETFEMYIITYRFEIIRILRQRGISVKKQLGMPFSEHEMLYLKQ